MSETLQKAKEYFTELDDFISNQTLDSMDNIIIEAEDIGDTELAGFIKILRFRKIAKEENSNV